VDAQTIYNLQSHLQTCESCQNYIAEFQQIEKQLREILPRRWARRSMDAADYRQIIDGVHPDRSRPRHLANLAPRFVEAFWLGAIVVGMLLLFWYFQKLDVPKDTPPTLPNPAPTPTAFEMEPSIQRDITAQNDGSAQGPLTYYANPFISPMGAGQRIPSHRHQGEAGGDTSGVRYFRSPDR
jgi:hypothetical protein